MSKNKAPAFQFYVKDWLSDPQLGFCSPSTRGIWVDVLCFMYWENGKGVLQATDQKWAQLCRCTLQEFKLFFNEATKYRFCDISEVVTNDNRIITIMSRRMVREYNDKEKNRLKQARYRKRQKGNQKITLHSPSPSPFPNNNPPNGGHFSKTTGGYFKEIEAVGKKIQSMNLMSGKKPFNVWQLIQEWANKQIHPGAIAETLTGASPYLNGKDPQKYLRAIIKTKAQNWREKGFIIDHEQEKQAWEDLIRRMKSL